MYQLFVIVDTCVTLFVLRSYRNALKKMYLVLYKFIKVIVNGDGLKRKTPVTIVKSVNNFIQ